MAEAVRVYRFADSDYGAIMNNVTLQKKISMLVVINGTLDGGCVESVVCCDVSNYYEDVVFSA